MVDQPDFGDDDQAAQQDRRGTERFDGWANAKVRLNFSTILPATVVDLSRSGCRMRTSRPVAVGEGFTLKIGDVCVIRAEVVWARDGWHGCRFAAPLGPRALERFRTQWASEPEP